MGQIVIFLPLIKKMYISIKSRRPMLQASDLFRVTIWQFDLCFRARRREFPRKKKKAGNKKKMTIWPISKLFDNLTHIKTPWQFDPCLRPPVFSRWQFDNMTHAAALVIVAAPGSSQKINARHNAPHASYTRPPASPYSIRLKAFYRPPSHIARGC